MPQEHVLVDSDFGAADLVTLRRGVNAFLLHSRGIFLGESGGNRCAAGIYVLEDQLRMQGASGKHSAKKFRRPSVRGGTAPPTPPWPAPVPDSDRRRGGRRTLRIVYTDAANKFQVTEHHCCFSKDWNSLESVPDPRQLPGPDPGALPGGEGRRRAARTEIWSTTGQESAPETMCKLLVLRGYGCYDLVIVFQSNKEAPFFPFSPRSSRGSASPSAPFTKSQLPAAATPQH